MLIGVSLSDSWGAGLSKPAAVHQLLPKYRCQIIGGTAPGK